MEYPTSAQTKKLWISVPPRDSFLCREISIDVTWTQMVHKKPPRKPPAYSWGPSWSQLKYYGTDPVSIDLASNNPGTHTRDLEIFSSWLNWERIGLETIKTQEEILESVNHEQGRAKGRRSARLLGRPEPTASGSGLISLKAPDLL